MATPTSLLLPLQYLATSLLLSISLILFIYWKSYQWTTEYVTFWKFSFFFFFHTQHNSLEIIQFAEFIVSSFHFIATWSSKIYMYHRLFNSLLVEGHLGCFSLVTSTNKSTINIYVQVLYEKHFHFSGINVSGMLKISTVWKKCANSLKTTNY